MSVVLARLRTERRALIGLVLLAALLTAAAFAPLLAPYDPVRQLDLQTGQLLPPSFAHPFGTDRLSRDVLSRVLFGARISLGVALLAMALSVTIGTSVGLAAGYLGGRVDWILMRLVDAGLAIPRIFLLLVFVGLWDRLGLVPLIAILGVTSWFDTSRLVRAEVLSLKEREFMIAARALGVGRLRLIGRYLLPNVATPIIVTAALGMGQIVLVESGLSFLGVGVPKPTPSWGAIIAEGQQEGLLLAAPWITTFPGLAIVGTVIAFSLLGDGLQRALDPRTS